MMGKVDRFLKGIGLGFIYIYIYIYIFVFFIIMRKKKLIFLTVFYIFIKFV